MEVAFHNDRYLDVVYEVMLLSCGAGNCLTSEQKTMVNQRCDFWKAQLSVPESKLLYNELLNANGRQTREEAAGNLAVY